MAHRQPHKNESKGERMARCLGQSQCLMAPLKSALRRAEIPLRPAQIRKTRGARILTVTECERAMRFGVVHRNRQVEMAARGGEVAHEHQRGAERETRF